MKARSMLISTIALAALVVPARAGGTIPAASLDDFGQTKAKSFDDFAGRAVLMEYFAFW
jgi:hypothetical protein